MSRHPKTPARVLAAAVTAGRAVLTVIAAALVIWSFTWVLTRPLRSAANLEGRTEITVMHWGDFEETQIVQRLVESFERANPGVKVNRINAPRYFQKLKTMLAAGDPPDVFFMNGYALPIYEKLGALRPIDDFYQQAIREGSLSFDPDDMYRQPLDAFRYDGERLGSGSLYGLPMSFTPFGIYYNKDLFDRAGHPYPADDWTWDDYEAAARAIGRLDGVYGAAVDVTGSWTLRPMLRTFGTDIVSDDFRHVRADDPAVTGLMNRMRAWHEEPDAFRLFGNIETSVESGQDLFFAGRVGMYGPIGRWMVPLFREISGFEWDFAQLPRGTHRANVIVTAAWCIAAESDHPEIAWKIVNHFASPEAQIINSGYGLALPTLRSVAESPAFTQPDVPPSRDDLYLAAVERSSPLLRPAEPRVRVAITKATDSALRTRLKTVDQALEDLQDDIDRIYNSPLLAEDFPRVPWRWIAAGIALSIGAAFALGAVWWFRNRPSRVERQNEHAGLVMASPWILGFCLFYAGPMILAAVLAFTSWNGAQPLGGADFVGFANFVELFTNDPRFHNALRATAYFAALAVPLGQFVALAAAVLLARPSPGVNAARALWYLPTVLAGVSVAIMWRWVFDADNGLFNAALAPAIDLFNMVFGAGLAPPDWFGADAEALGVPAFSLMSAWMFGGAMLIYIAGINAIPQDLYESAAIDGAGPVRRFWSVTIPMLSPVILFNLTIAVIGSFQVFTQAYIIARDGGPNDATLFYVLYLYNEAFESHNMGYAAAMAWILFFIILGLTLLMFRISKKHVHYEGQAL